MRALLFGAGATGIRVARIFAADGRFDSVEVRDTGFVRRNEVSDSLGSPVIVGEGREIGSGTDVVVVATPVGTQTALARRALQSGAAVVTTTSGIAETKALLDVGQEARYHGVPLVVGAGFMPGFTCFVGSIRRGGVRCGRRDTRCQSGHGRPCLCCAASQGTQQPGHRLARRTLDSEDWRIRTGTVLVSRPSGGYGLL